MLRHKIFTWYKKNKILDIFYLAGAILTGMFIGYIEWGMDWEELPLYALYGLIFYIFMRIAHLKISKQEFILIGGAAAFGMAAGILESGGDIDELLIFTLSGVIVYVAMRSIYHIMTLGLQSIEDNPPIAQKENEIVVHLTLSLRERARKLKISGRFILLAILISITGGIQLFYNADSVARLNNGEYQLGKLVNDFERIVYGSYRFIRSDQEVSEESLEKFLIKVKSVTKAETDRYIDNSEPDPQEIIISTLTTRIGTIFLLLFLVQILVSLYRYSIKLAALYDGRADLLQLLPVSEELDLEKLVKLTSTDGLDFTKQEKPPADYALELAKKIIDKSGK